MQSFPLQPPRSRLHTTFHAASCYVEIAAWKQVYFTVWHARKLQRRWLRVRPLLRPLSRDAAIFFGFGTGLGFLAALASRLVSLVSGF